MKKIRNNTFETNSSSTHSIAIVGRRNISSNALEINDDDGYIHVEFGDFGWEVHDYDEQYEKLQYLVTMCAMLNGFYPEYDDYGEFGSLEDTDIEEIYNNFMHCDDFERISDTVAEYADCKGVIVDASRGYIDHQSYEDYGCLDEYLYNCGVDIAEFIYGNVVVHTDNDNH